MTGRVVKRRKAPKVEVETNGRARIIHYDVTGYPVVPADVVPAREGPKLPPGAAALPEHFERRCSRHDETPGPRAVARRRGPSIEFLVASDGLLVRGKRHLLASCEMTVVEAPQRAPRTEVVDEPEQGPQVRWVMEQKWPGLGWDATTVGEVHASADTTVIHVNRNQRLLVKAVDANRRIGTEAIKRRANRYLLPVACALCEQHRAVAGGQTVEDAYVVGEMERLAEAVLLVMDQDALGAD